MSASPLPWKVSTREIYDANGVRMALISGQTKPVSEDAANAALIVRAVNSNAEMVAALQKIASIPTNSGATEQIAVGALCSALNKLNPFNAKGGAQ